MKLYSLSIIIPVFNSKPFIEQALESIILQPSFNDIEVVIVDDGSTDNTSEICERYCKFKNFKYLKTENSGTGHARNLGIKNATGDWIIFLDHDDLIVYNSLTIDFVNNKLKYFMDDAIDVVCCPYYLCDFLLENIPSLQKVLKDDMAILSRCFWSNIYRRRFLTDKKISFFEYKQFDIETAFRSIIQKEKPNIIILPDKPFYIHRTNPNSAMNTANYEIVFGVKLLAYFDLFLRYNDYEYLYYTYLLISDYSRVCLKQHYYTDFTIHNKVKYIFKLFGNYKGKYFLNRISFRRRVTNSIFIFVSLHLLKNKKKPAIKCNKTSLPYFTFSKIKKRYIEIN